MNSKLRLMTTQLAAISAAGGTGGGGSSVSGTVTIGNSPDVGQTRGPWAVSGTLSVNPHAVFQTAGPWAVSGTVAIGNVPDVKQAGGPWAVSGGVQVTLGTPLISTANSSTTPLTAGASFTGTFEDVSGYATLVVSVFTDQPASGVLFSQYSSDGVNTDFRGTHAMTTSGQVLAFTPRTRFFRLSYTNGPNVQTIFRLQTIYHPLPTLPVQTMPMVPTSDPNPTTYRVAANLQVRNTSDGTWQALAADASGKVVVRRQDKTVAHGANPTAVAAGIPADSVANRAGVPFVIGGHPNPICLRANYLGTQTDTAVVAGAGGQIIVVTSFMVTVDSGASGSVGARLGFGTSTTPTGVGVVGSHPGIAAGSGYGRGSGAGILGAGTDGQALRLTTTAVPGGNGLDVNLTYFTIEG